MQECLMEPRLVGYARVSTDDQDLSLQIDALTRQGIPRTAVFMDKLSGAKTERPGLTKCLVTLQSGDILVVWRLDRLGRSMRHLITLVEDLRNKGIGFRSINEGAIDTTCASGELIFNIFSALAQFIRPIASSPPWAFSHLKTSPAMYQPKVGGVFNIEPSSAIAL